MTARQRLIVRIALALAAALGLLIGPAWLSIGAAVVSSLFFRAWEMLPIGLLADFLWLPARSPIPLYTLGAIAIVWALEPLRREFLR